MTDASAACLECAQTKTCTQDERCMRAQCCLCRCYPQCCYKQPDTDCSRFSCSCNDGGSVPPDRNGDGTFIILIGGLLVAGAIGAAVLKTRKKPAEPVQKDSGLKKEEKKEQKLVRYVLQLSKDTVRVSGDKNDSFTVTIWKLLETGEYIKQPGAPIQVSGPSIPGLLVHPNSGMGTLQVTVSLSKPVPVTSAELTISASAGGMTQKATVHITIEQSLQVGFE
ncbi:hypothetical protein [Methanospirillum hungatei]|uniref:hypothetical protein n=1 Tax=Methanospirillum hungatei TaxID=2203 RepID=UPI0026F1964F|nr:hypothetical protein [Methanospirillum hungatei]MCA1915167.1 hypothetical protein [Methanospirillum hungatei]